ncbi:MAG: MlaE family ABC transporter permease, partial [Rhodospirillaceae bacterium]
HVRRRPVRISAVFQHARDMGISALPIIILMNGAVGIMLAIQGIYTLRLFGAEEKVVFGVALSVVREFSPVITGIIVAGRTGSALAARLGTMRINQEIDALSVMGIDPVRFLVAPALLAILVMLPLLTFVGMMIAMSGAALYVSAELGMSLSAYATETLSVLTLNDLTHGLGKTLIFAMIIVLVGVVNGASVTGGAEGVGRMTTRSVVQGICGILVTDMIFAFVLAR